MIQTKTSPGFFTIECCVPSHMQHRPLKDGESEKDARCSWCGCPAIRITPCRATPLRRLMAARLPDDTPERLKNAGAVADTVEKLREFEDAKRLALRLYRELATRKARYASGRLEDHDPTKIRQAITVLGELHEDLGIDPIPLPRH